MQLPIPRTTDSSLLQVTFRDVPTRLEQKFAFARPFLFQLARNAHEFFPFYVIQHNDVGTSVDRFIGLCF